MNLNKPECSHDPDQQICEQSNTNEATPRNIQLYTERASPNISTNLDSPGTTKPISLSPTIKQNEKENRTPLQLGSNETLMSLSLASTIKQNEKENRISLQLRSIPLVIGPSFHSAIICQPRSNLRLSVIMPNQPHSLFIQALSKLNENSIILPGQLKATTQANGNHIADLSRDVTPPSSLTSAPPSYSYVLNQMAARRRPRLMGTFIPSPSFVQHTPPPTYATAFDIYVDNCVPTPPPRVCHFGFASMPAICPECGYAGMTVVISKITLCTHMCAFVLCLFCCWICAPLPYILRSCKDVYHYCQNCRTFLGMYCPTNPDNNINNFR